MCDNPEVSPLDITISKLLAEHCSGDMHVAVNYAEEPPSPEEEIIFNGPATVLYSRPHPHGETVKRVVKCTDGDEFNPRYAYLLLKFMESTGWSRTKISHHLEKIDAQWKSQVVTLEAKKKRRAAIEEAKEAKRLAPKAFASALLAIAEAGISREG